MFFFYFLYCAKWKKGIKKIYETSNILVVKSCCALVCVSCMRTLGVYSCSLRCDISHATVVCVHVYANTMRIKNGGFFSHSHSCLIVPLYFCMVLILLSGELYDLIKFLHNWAIEKKFTIDFCTIFRHFFFPIKCNEWFCFVIKIPCGKSVLCIFDISKEVFCLNAGFDGNLYFSFRFCFLHLVRVNW